VIQHWTVKGAQPRRSLCIFIPRERGASVSEKKLVGSTAMMTGCQLLKASGKDQMSRLRPKKEQRVI